MNQNQVSDFFCAGSLEIREERGAAGSADLPVRHVVRGYAALFNVRSREMRTHKGRRFVEEIMPGAFDKADFSDAECRFNHNRFLAAPPTARFGVDARGLWYEYDHDPMDPDHVATFQKIKRGDVKGSSMMYDEVEDGDQEVTFENGIYVRKIKAYRKMWDYGPVVRPAYKQTSVGTFMRSLDALADAEELPGEAALETVVEAAAETEQRDMSGAYDADTNPTQAQKEAGNYKKGKVKVAGMEISIENPAGSMRSGVGPDGTAWERLMTAHYGYILGSKASDEDNLDVFLTDDAETATVVWVVDQVNEDGSFDEHKCLIGPVTEAEARALYLAHYPAGWTGLGAICCLPMEVFKSWAMDGTSKKNPLMYTGLQEVEMVVSVDDRSAPGGDDQTPEAADAEAADAEAAAIAAAEAEKQAIIERRRLQLRATLI